MKNIISGLGKLTATSILVVSLVACGGAEERKVKYLEKGKSFLENKNYDKAKIEFKNVLQIDPKFAEAYFYMGELELNNKELGKALGNYKKAIELNPDYVEAKIKLAKVYVIAGAKDLIELAKKLLSEVEKVQPNNSEMQLILATIDYKTGSKSAAKRSLEKIVKEDNKLHEAISLLVRLYLFEGDEINARELLLSGVKNNPKNIRLRITLAKLLAKDGELLEAEKYLQQAISIEPEKYSLKVALSSFYATSNQLEKAEAVLRNAILQDDEDVQRYLVLVELLSTRVSIKKADEELQSIIENNPELYDLQFAQVSFYEKTGRREEAKSALGRIIADKSDEIEGIKARNLLAVYLLEEGDKNSAKKYIDEVIAEYPSNNDALLLVGKLSLANLDAISAINSLRTVVKNNPKNAEATLLLAQAHELNNESSLAENELKKAIQTNPINEKVHVNYARYLGSKGRIDETLEIVDKALAYFKDSYDLMNIKLKIVASQGKETEMLALMSMMEQANANNAEVNINKGQYYLAKRKVPEAIEQFEKAYEKSQNKYKPLELIVKTYMAINQPEKALQRLQENIEKNSKDAISHLLIGQVYLAQKKYVKARKQFKQSSKFAEAWFSPYSSLAASYLMEKNIDMALSVYKEAEAKLKNKVPAQMQIASMYEQQKKFSAAMTVYQNILSENEGNKLAENNYASLLLDHGSEADAAKALELAKGLKNLQKPALQDTLAWAYAKTGDSAKAVEILKPIVEKAPKVAVFRYHLGYALYHMGDKAAAKSHLEIAVSSKQVFPGKDNAAVLLKSI